MDDVNNIFKNISNVLKLLSHGLEAMAKKTNEINKAPESELKEECREKSIEESKVEDSSVIIEEKNKDKEESKEVPFDSKVAKAKDIKDVKYLKNKAKTKIKIKTDKKPVKTKKVEKTEPIAQTVQENTKIAGTTMTDTILEIFNNSTEPLSTDLLVEKTGFNNRPVQDVIYRLRRLGKIKKVGNKTYSKI